MDFIDIIEWL